MNALPIPDGGEVVVSVIKTFDPFRQQELSQYREDSDEEVLRKIRLARKASEEFRGDIDQRKQYLRDTVKRNLERMKGGELARTITMEMGKPIKQSIAEVEKCIRLVDYAVENIERFYAPEPVMTEARKSYVRFDPIGVVMAIMPWNFPVWQVMRAAVPAISAGNGVVLKHASITTGTALMIQEVFDSEAFSTLLLRGGSDALRYIPHVDGVTFTGSTSVGARVAEEAGKHIKKCVLELGGSDPFIVLGSADIRETAKQAALARLQNNGQSCIASKRFLVQGSIYEEFREALEEEFSRVVQGGDPHGGEHLPWPAFIKGADGNGQEAGGRAQGGPRREGYRGREQVRADRATHHSVRARGCEVRTGGIRAGGPAPEVRYAGRCRQARQRHALWTGGRPYGETPPRKPRTLYRG